MSEVLCATDGSPAATEGVRRSVEIAALRGANVVFVHAVPWTDPRVRGREIAGQLTSRPLEVTQNDHALQAAAKQAEQRGVRYRLLVAPGDIVDVILDTARRSEPDLIVVGSDSTHTRRGRHGIGETLSRRASCDVLVVREAP